MPKVPEILCERGQPFYGEGYAIKLGTDDIIIGGDTCDGYIVSYGDGLYRSFDAVQRLRHLGINIGLVNKWHVNAVDDRVMSIIGRSRFVLVVELLVCKFLPFHSGHQVSKEIKVAEHSNWPRASLGY